MFRPTSGRLPNNNSNDNNNNMVDIILHCEPERTYNEPKINGYYMSHEQQRFVLAWGPLARYAG